MAASGASSDKLYVDDVFSTYLYTGNGSTQTINNGIDLAGKGGLVWFKERGPTGFSHALFTSDLGGSQFLTSNSTAALIGGAAEISFGSSGISLLNGHGRINTVGSTYASWTFRKAPKFFDCGTYTGDGNAGRQITHSLSTNLGMVIIKATSTTGSWQVLHRGSNGTSDIKFGTLETTNALSTVWGDYSVYFNASTFTPGVWSMNASGVSYVWYAFAHDPSAEGIIQCGSVVGGSSVNLGWEPQYILLKNSNTTSDWYIFDTMRGIATGGSDPSLAANTSGAELGGTNWINLTATGFEATSLSNTLIYLAIRRPNKPPTTGTQVYNAIARTGTSAAATVTGVGFAPDLVAIKKRSTGDNNIWFDRLRGASQKLFTDATVAEIAESTNKLDVMDGYGIGIAGDVNGSGSTYINHFFKRAPGVFDVVCYTGTGSAITVAHSLGVAPELMIFKQRNPSSGWTFAWYTWHKSMVLTQLCALNTDYPTNYGGSSLTQAPTSTTIHINNNANAYLINEANISTVAYLFATKAGISKVGSYTGNGTSQTINAGFATGARFVLIKRTDSAGDWYVWDSARGIVSANDPHLSLNTTAAEVTTDDSIDPDSTGFVVNQVAATNVNVNAATYIYLAFA